MKIRKGAVLALIAVLAAALCAFAVVADNKDKVAIFKSIDVPADAAIEGDSVAIFGNVNVDGMLRGDVVAICGNVIVTGTVDGNAVAVLGTISVKDNGVITGDAAGVGGGVEKGPNAAVRGEIADVSMPFSVGRHGIIPRVTLADMIVLTVIFAFSCLVVLIIPERVSIMAAEGKNRPARRFAIGFVASLLFLPAAVILSVILAITVVGIIFIPLIFIGFALAVFIGIIALEVAVGQRITGMLEGRNSIYIYLLVGLIIMYVVKLVPIVGWLAYLVFVTLALGVVIDTRLGAPAVRKQAPNA